MESPQFIWQCADWPNFRCDGARVSAEIATARRAQGGVEGKLAALGFEQRQHLATDAWTAETAGTDAFTPLVLASQWAPQLRLGTAIVPVYTRGPGLLAMQAATVAELAPGRFVLGIGASSPVIVSGWNAAAFEERR